jgi:type IV secretory pathway VirJ component
MSRSTRRVLSKADMSSDPKTLVEDLTRKIKGIVETMRTGDYYSTRASVIIDTKDAEAMADRLKELLNKPATETAKADGAAATTQKSDTTPAPADAGKKPEPMTLEDFNGWASAEIAKAIGADDSARLGAIQKKVAEVRKMIEGIEDTSTIRIPVEHDPLQQPDPGAGTNLPTPAAPQAQNKPSNFQKADDDGEGDGFDWPEDFADPAFLEAHGKGEKVKKNLQFGRDGEAVPK